MLAEIQQRFIQAQNKFNSQSNPQKFSALLIKLQAQGSLKDKFIATVKMASSERNSIQSLQYLLGELKSRNKKRGLYAAYAIKQIYEKNIFSSFNQLKPFCQLIKKGQNEQKAYLQHRFKELYMQFLKGLQELMSDQLLYLKRQAVDLAAACLKFQQENRFILKVFVNKFGDNDKKFVNVFSSKLSALIKTMPGLVFPVVKQIQMLIFRPGIKEVSKMYSLKFLGSLNPNEQDPTTNSRIIDIFFRMVKQYCERAKSQQNTDSRIFLMSLKGLNKIFSQLKNSLKNLIRLAEDKTDTLFYVFHKTNNLKIKIQVLVFLHQVQTCGGTHSQRFYRLLYQLLLIPSLQQTHTLQVLFDVLFQVLVQDHSIDRVNSFIKRLLQLCQLSNPGFILTSLFLLSKIMVQRPEIAAMINKPPARLGGIQQFKEDKRGRIINTAQTQQSYAPFKRDPKFSNAQVGMWQILALRRHYHPQVSRIADQLVKDPLRLIQMKGNPLKQKSISNFMKQVQMRRTSCETGKKKGDSLLDRMLRGKLQDQQKFIQKYLQRKSKQKRKKPAKRELDQQEELQHFADQFILNEINQNRQDNLDQLSQSEPSISGQQSEVSLSEHQSQENLQFQDMMVEDQDQQLPARRKR